MTASAAGHTGVVEQVGLFTTTLFTPTHDTIFIPNGAIASGSIINHTAGVLRARSCGRAYGVDVETVVEELRQAAESVEAVLDDPGVGVAFTKRCQQSRLPGCLHVPPAGLFATTGAVRKAVYDRLNAGIDIRTRPSSCSRPAARELRGVCGSRRACFSRQSQSSSSCNSRVCTSRYTTLPGGA